MDAKIYLHNKVSTIPGSSLSKLSLILSKLWGEVYCNGFSHKKILMLLPIEPNPWQILSEETVYDNNWIKVTHANVLTPSNTKGIYGKVHFKNIAIGIVALTAADEVLLVGQYRFPTNIYSWEIPEGGASLGENPLDAAKRELLEETGYSAQDWAELQRMQLSNSVTDEQAIIYIATTLTAAIATPEETEKLQFIKLPFKEVLRKIYDGEITDAITVAAIYRVALLRTKD